MQIFEIQEPSTNRATTVKKELAVGIDFGTSNSLVAYSLNHNAYVIDDELIPSIISDELDIGKGHLLSIKRLIGKSFAEIMEANEISENIKKSIKEENGVIKIQIGNKYFTLPESIALILKFLKQKAELHLQNIVTKAVITVPAHFNDVERSVIKEAASIAGLDILRLISEPTAAAYCYGLENSSEGLYVVYDLGGGTFDISLLNMKMGVFQVLATGGDTNLGGDDIDHLVFEYFKETANQNISDDKLRMIAKEAKEFLTFHKNYHNEKFDLSIDIDKFEKLIEHIIERSITITNSVISKFLQKINGIIIVGGSSRIPLIRKKLEVFSTTIFDHIDPDKIVATGAALQAENLTSGSKNLIIDVVPLSLGLELMGGISEKIIMRGTPIPTSVTKEFTTYADNQTALQIHIVQGEREFVKDCRSIAKFEVNIPPMKAGAVMVELLFKIDADGLLSIEILEKFSNSKKIIEVRPTYGITENDVISMLENAYKNAEEDHNLRLLAITRMEAQQEVKSTEAALSETPELISIEEIKDIRSKITDLQKSLKNDDRDKILLLLDGLRNKIKKFSELRMDFAVQQILKGKEID